MKEAIAYTAVELTRQPASPRLDRGVIFMAEPVVAELSKTTPHTGGEAPVFTWHVAQVPQEETFAKEAFTAGELTLPLVINPEASLRQSWDVWEQSLPAEQKNDPATAETIRYAIEMGIAPVTPTKETLDKNARLSDADRLEEARRLLNAGKLTDVQKEAIIHAHEVGKGEKGKDRVGNAGVHNYTREQLREKAEMLKKAGISKEQRRILMEHAIVGTASEVPPISDERLKRIADDMRTTADAEKDRFGNPDPSIPLDFIKGQIERIDRMLDEPQEADRPDPVEAMELKSVLRRWGEQTIEAQRRESEQQGRAKGEKGVLPEAAAIEAYIASRRANPDGTPGAPRNIALEKQFIKAIKEKMQDPTIPPIGGYHFPTDLLAAAASFKETRDMFLTSVVFKPYDDATERNQYQIDLYAGDRLKTLLEAIRKDPNLTPEERDREYQQQLGLDTAAELFHTMNGRILAGSLGEFIRVA
jgi:phosphohistidine swiveling domain-containing protein